MNERLEHKRNILLKEGMCGGYMLESKESLRWGEIPVLFNY